MGNEHSFSLQKNFFNGVSFFLVLMRMLHRFSGPKPQIVGLTASLPLGAGRANVEAALDVCFFSFMKTF